MPRGKAWRRLATRISARSQLDSQAIPDAKFCGRENFSKFSVRNRMRIARNLTRRSMPTLGAVFGDLHASRQGLASSSNVDFGAISRDFGRIENFAAAKNFRNFRSEIRCESHEISRAAACQRSAQCLETFMHRGKAWRRRATRISARSRAIPNAKFCVREKFSKISVRNPLRIARNLTRRSMPTLGTVFGDLHASRQGLASSGNAEFGAISRDSERKILRPRKIFETFEPKSVANRTKSHAPRHADARNSVWGPSCLAARLGVVWQRGFRCDLTRSCSSSFFF